MALRGRWWAYGVIGDPCAVGGTCVEDVCSAWIEYGRVVCVVEACRVDGGDGGRPERDRRCRRSSACGRKCSCSCFDGSGSTFDHILGSGSRMYGLSLVGLRLRGGDEGGDGDSDGDGNGDTGGDADG